jgi:PhnB protein
LFNLFLTAGRVVVAAESYNDGWRLGRIIDLFGHHWEIGRPPD